MKEMIHTMFFLDDCFLESTDAIKRVWHQPEFKAESDMSEKPVNQWGVAYPTVIHDNERNIYRCWYSGTDGVDEKYKAWYLHYAESIDGWIFKPVGAGLDKLNPASEIAKFSGRIESMVFCEKYLFGADVVFDPYENDCDKKFKLCYIKGEIPLSANWFCGIAYSPDGFKWTTDGENPWFPVMPESVSDTVHLIRYNPLTRKYQIICRPAHGDRRVAIVESENGINWTKPRLILEPDGQDPDAMQFYAMPAFYYNGIWIGLLWEMRTDPMFRGNPQGPIDVHITYSYNGLDWTRAKRLPDGPDEPFIPLRKKGEYGGNAIEASSLITAPDGNIRIYANGFLNDHSCVHDPSRNGIAASTLLAYGLRKDGFVSLNAGKEGMIITKPLNITGNFLGINCNVDGWMRIGILNEDGSSIPGFTIDECTPFKGDALSWTPRWGKNSPGKLKGKKVKLVVRWSEGELYSIFGDIKADWRG